MEDAARALEGQAEAAVPNSGDEVSSAFPPPPPPLPPRDALPPNAKLKRHATLQAAELAMAKICASMLKAMHDQVGYRWLVDRAAPPLPCRRPPGSSFLTGFDQMAGTKDIVESIFAMVEEHDKARQVRYTLGMGPAPWTSAARGQRMWPSLLLHQGGTPAAAGRPQGRAQQGAAVSALQLCGTGKACGHRGAQHAAAGGRVLSAEGRRRAWRLAPQRGVPVRAMRHAFSMPWPLFFYVYS